MAGCGSAALEAPPEAVEDVSDSGAVGRSAERLRDAANRRVFNSGPVTMKVNRTDGSVAWSIDSESSRVGVEEAGGSQGFLTDVKGELYAGDEVATSFTASEAKADSESMTFKLFGGVQLRSEQYGALIESDEVEWVEEEQIYIARGNVRVSTKGWTLGPSSTIYADKKLTQMTNNKEDLDL